MVKLKRSLRKNRLGQNIHRGRSQCFEQYLNVHANDSGAYVTGSLAYDTIWAFEGMPGIATPALLLQWILYVIILILIP